MGGVDREILEGLIGCLVQIINDENFVLTGIVKEVFGKSVSIQTGGNLRYLSFDRIKEIRLANNRGNKYRY